MSHLMSHFFASRRRALAGGALSLLLALAAPVALAQPVLPSGGAPAYRLELRGGAFTPPANLEEFFGPAGEPADITGGVYFRLVQFWELPTKERRARLERAWHARLLDYLPKNTYVVAFPASFNRQLLMGYQVRSVFKLAPEQRLHPLLLAGTAPAHALRPGNTVEVLIETILAEAAPDPAALRAATRAALTAAGALDLAAPDSTAPHRLRARVPLKRLREIAAIPSVLSIEAVPAPPQREDRPSRSSHRSNYLNSDDPLGRHYDGTGVRVALGDDGILGPHIDYQGRYEQSRVNSDAGSHGDHTGGIIGGGGNLDPRQRGIAPGVSVSVYDPFENIDLAPVDFGTIGVRITSTSYGDGCHSGYTAAAQAVDRQTRQHPALLHVFSAGNSGTSNCGFLTGWGNITGGNKSGKNVLALGAVDANDVLAGFSSRGPTQDGRIKPDLCTVGVDVNSTQPNNTYGLNSGTSMACPGMAGSAALLYQLWRARHGGQDPAAALIKAAVLGTADDLGNPGPDFQYGYGRLNARRAALALEGEHFFSDSVDQGDVRTYSLTVPAGTQQIRVLTHWTDYEGSVLAGRALVNDLDAELIGVANDTLRPWVLDPRPSLSTINLPAVRSRDTLNNAELITLDVPAPGTYSLRVRGAGVAQGPQTFYAVWELVRDSIVVTYPMGGESFAPADQEIIRWDAYGTSGPFSVEVSDDAGATWAVIGTPAGTARQLAWNPPVARLGQRLLLRVRRGALTGQSATAFSIQSPPTGLQVTRVCPDSTTLQWTAVTGAVRYDVYRLGATRMDSVGTTTQPRIVIGGISPLGEEWLSVRAVRANGARSRRAIALRRAPGLVNCTQAVDGQVFRILSPLGGTRTVCGAPRPVTVAVEVRNAGAQPLAGARVFYRVSGGAVVSDSVIGPLAPGAIRVHTFSTPAALPPTGAATLVVWARFGADANRYNDSARVTLTLAAGTVATLPLTQSVNAWAACSNASDCEATVCGLGGGWTNAANGTSDNIDWRVNAGATPSANTGPDVDHTLGTAAGRYLYLEASNGCSLKTAVLASPCIDLAANPLSDFVCWYHAYGANMGELHLDIVPDSGAARLDFTPPIIGDQGNLWHELRVPLGSYRGRVVTVQLRGITGNDFASDLALDDFAVVPSVLGLSADARAFADRLTLAPNPTTGTVRLGRPDLVDGPLAVTVLDVQGRVIARQTLTGLTATFELGAAPAGTYLVRVVSERTSVVRRLAVTR